MADLQEALRRRRQEVRPDEGAFERLVHRRIRRRRAQRAVSAAVALLLAAVAAWELGHAFTRPSPIPGNLPINRQNVSRLELSWSTPSTGAAPITPPTSGDEVYVIGATVRAYPTTCKAVTCGPRWVGDRGGIHEVADVAVGGHLVLIVSDDVQAFPQDCARGGASCKPTWVSRRHSLGFYSVSVTDGVVYAQAHSGIWAFPERCSLSCRPLWHAHLVAFGGHLVSSGGGLVFLQDESTVKVFRSSCRSDGGFCHPLWEVANSSFGSRPVYSDGRVYVTRGLDEVAAYPVRCDRTGECRPETVWHVPDAIGIAVSDGRVYVTTNDSVLAFDAACPNRAGCPALWRTRALPSDPSVPTVALGLIFFTAGDRVYAVPADCGSGGAECSPVWSERLPGGAGTSLSPPTVTDRAVFVVSAGGTLYSFEVPAR
jgi:outer membrane protein assembly factor BamB